MAAPPNASAATEPAAASGVIGQSMPVIAPVDDGPLLRLESRLPPLLAIIAGMVDVTGFFTLGNVFTAHITGNVAVVSAVAAQGKAPSLIQAVMIPVFIFAVAATWLLARASGLSGVPLARLLLFVQFLLLTVLSVFCAVAMPSLEPRGTAAGFAATIAVSAMACQFVLFRMALPGSVSTAVMTGNVTNTALYCMDRLFARDNPIMGDEADYLKRSGKLLLGFVGGCAAAGVAITVMGDWTWSLPAALAAVAIAVR